MFSILIKTLVCLHMNYDYDVKDIHDHGVEMSHQLYAQKKGWA